MPGEHANPPAIDLWLVHGNLQTPAVWGAFASAFEEAGLNVHAVELMATLADSMPAWAAAFSETVRAAGDTDLRVVLGYSLGGRLALHALLDDPTLWNGAILVGADTGLADENARARRREVDATWSRRFLGEPLGRVLADWNGQPVFAGRPAVMDVTLLEKERARIAQMFMAYSKGRQRDLLPELARTLRIPTLWLTGADDPAFTLAARDAAAVIPEARCNVVLGAAHRVPWEAPEAFLEAALAFITLLSHDWQSTR